MTSTSRAAASNGVNGADPAGAFGSSRWSPTDESVEGVNGCKGEEGERSGDEGPAFSLHSQEGDTEAANMVIHMPCHSMAICMSSHSLKSYTTSRPHH